MAYRVGTDLDDILNGTAGDDIIIGKGGKDIITVGGGLDYVDAGNGRDVITAGSGISVIYGGGSADTFAFAANATGEVYIGDFHDGKDILDVSALNVTGMADLTITAITGGSMIAAAGMTVYLAADPADLSAADFIFAPPPKTRYDFEDLDMTKKYGSPVPKAYGGLDWSGFSVIELDQYRLNVPASGYVAQSGDTLIFNEFGGTASISRDTDFDLEKLFLSAGWSDGLKVTIEGWNDGVLIGSQTVKLAYGVIKKVTPKDAIFDAVDTVVFTASGGTDIPDDDGVGSHFGLDNLLILG